jgi:DNA-binding transcriptional LysR family regulator
MSLLHKNLEALKAIAEAKSVHGAADLLSIDNNSLTATAVTQRLKLLEAEVGVSLFERSRRGMKITPEGEVLLRYCYASDAMLNECLDALKNSGTKSTAKLAIAGPTSLMCSRITPTLTPIMKKYPELLVEFIYADENNSVELLHQGKIHCAVILKEQLEKEMMHRPLAPEEYVLVAPSAWKNRPLKEIISTEKIIDFNPQDDMTFRYLKKYRLHRKIYQRHFANHPESIATLIEAELGYSVLEKSFAMRFIQEKKLCVLNEGKTYLNEIVLVWYYRPLLPAYFSALIQALR